MINGLLAGVFLLAVVFFIMAVVKHPQYFAQHYILWGAAGLLFVAICTGYMLIFADEATLQEKGRLLLTEKGFTIGNDAFLLSMIRKAVVVVKGYRGQRQRNHRVATGSTNSVIFFTMGRQEIACNFLLKSQEELELLKELLSSWRTHGIQLVTEGIELG